MNKITNWSVLFRIGLKKDWKRLVFWILGIGLFSGGFLGAFKVIGEDQGLIGMYETMLNPAMISMVGPTPILDSSLYTVGAMYAQEMTLFSALFAFIVSSVHTISRTRKEEDEGISELLHSFTVGRFANSFALLIESLLVHAFIVILIILLMMGFGEDFWGILLFASAIGFTGLLGFAMGLLSSELMPNASMAHSFSLSIMGVLFLLRAMSDVSFPAMSYLNPLAWSYLVFPFTTNQAYLLVLMFILWVVLISFSFKLAQNRDLGSSYIPERHGKASAKGWLLSFGGLFVRLNQLIIFSWLIGLLVMGLAYGSIFGDMQIFLEGNEFLLLMFSSLGVSIEVSFASSIIVVLVCLSAFLPIGMMSRQYSEERDGRLSMVFRSRLSLYWTSVLISSLFGLIGLFFAISGLGIVAMSVLSFDMILISGLSYIPFLLFVVGMNGFFLGFRPSYIKYSYLYVGFCFVVSYFGSLINLPSVMMNLSVIHWLAKMPVESFRLEITILVCLLSVVLASLGSYFYSKRDFCA